MKIQLALQNDIDSWMELVTKSRNNFPGLETKEALLQHRETVLEFMKRQEAICAKENDAVVGELLFSKENNTLCFLAVNEEYRRQHIAQKMVSYMLSFLNPQQDILVSTYREDDPNGKAARAFYRHMGFVEGELAEEFGSPVQIFVLKR